MQQDAPGYVRIKVSEAIKEHAAEILELRKLYDQAKEESDLVLLRYVLSFPEVKKAGEALTKARKYREENKSWLEHARKIKELPSEQVYALCPAYDKLKKHMVIPSNHKTTVRFLFSFLSSFCSTINDKVFGGPICYIRAGMTDLDRLLQHVSVEELTQYFVFDKEVIYNLCDEATKKSGFLTKALYIMDSSNISMFPNRRFFGALGDSSKVSETLHPQLVQRQCVINAGLAFRTVFKVASLFMSKKTLERFTICTSFSEKESALACPYISKWVHDMSVLPTFCGGTCECEDGCLSHIPNSYKGYVIDLREKK